MGSMDLLTIPGLDNKETYRRLRLESKERMARRPRQRNAVKTLAKAVESSLKLK